MGTGQDWKGPYWQARKRMENTGLERTDRQGVAGTEWRMQIGGERLGRVGIVRVAVGQARRGMAR